MIEKETFSTPESHEQLDDASVRLIELVQNTLSSYEPDINPAGLSSGGLSLEIDQATSSEISGTSPISPETVSVYLGYEEFEPRCYYYRIEFRQKGGYLDGLSDAAAGTPFDVTVWYLADAEIQKVSAQLAKPGYKDAYEHEELEGERGATVIHKFCDTAELIIGQSEKPLQPF